MCEHDPRCTGCDSRRVATIHAGQPYCAPCAIEAMTPQAEHAEAEARYSPPAREPQPYRTPPEVAARCAAIRDEMRASQARYAGRPYPLPRGVMQAEAAGGAL